MDNKHDTQIILCPETYPTWEHLRILPSLFQTIYIAQPLPLSLPQIMENPPLKTHIHPVFPKVTPEAISRLRALINEARDWTTRQKGDMGNLIFYQYQALLEQDRETMDDILKGLGKKATDTRFTPLPWEMDFLLLSIVHEWGCLREDLKRAEKDLKDQEEELISSFGPIEEKKFPSTESLSDLTEAVSTFSPDSEIWPRILMAWTTLYSMLEDPPSSLWIQEPFIGRILLERLERSGISYKILEKGLFITLKDLSQVFGISIPGHPREDKPIRIFLQGAYIL